jgi:signal transduction histidine kinase
MSGAALAASAMLVARTVLRAPVAAGTWRSVAYTLVTTVLAVPAFALALLGIVAAALSLALIGLPALVAVLIAARATVRYFRWPARRFLGRSWAGPEPLGGRGPVGRARAVLADGRAWRALAYCFLRLPLATATAYATVAAIGIGLISLTCPVWSALPSGSGPLELDTWWDSWTVAAGGAVVLLAFSWPLWLLTRLDGLLVDALLTPGRAARRIARLESSRAVLTADAATTLRRLERDLHDGTQARLVSLGVALSRIEQRVNRLPGDPNEIREIRRLVDAARDTVTEGLAELRDIVRGIHPPALDDGLATALTTLASRSGLPVEVRVELTAPPVDAVATTMYFAAAELLANAARHSGAHRVALRLTEDDATLRLVVTDDGRGGAALAPGAGRGGAGSAGRDGAASGTGLAGLAHRAEALDGRLDVRSPPGGPTTVAVTLPRG